MEYITYEMFGAAGDGKTNDMPAIMKTHEEANRLNLPVKSAPGACYFIENRAATAVVKTSVDWTGSKFIIDDRELDDIKKPVFSVVSCLEPVKLELTSLKAGQERIENPTGLELYVQVKNDNHRDYIRKGPNQNSGTSRQDCFVVRPDGTLTSPVSFDFDEITSVYAMPMDEPLNIRGGEFTTIANIAESRYTYHARNIAVSRSNVEVDSVKHYVTGEEDHGAPYSGFLSVTGCAHTWIHDCVFTAHKTYWTIGSADKPVPMGSYDINCGNAADIRFERCTQTTDIMDRAYWGLIGSNFCRDMVLEDCVFSRFDAHMGVANCTIRRCKLGHQCLNAIGFGTFVIEDTEACGYAFVNLRDDYGCTWKGDMVIKNCTWNPLGANRHVFNAHNDGTHDFGYPCYLPQNVTIDGLHVTGGCETLAVFNDWRGNPDGEVKYPMVKPKQVSVKNITGADAVVLCTDAELLKDTEYIK
ncbi:MAG: hypothetical protein IJ037_06065 [Clostridia bacterium]|nr:hypothetical protein [Clostridia bacterium]